MANNSYYRIPYFIYRLIFGFEYNDAAFRNFIHIVEESFIEANNFQPGNFDDSKEKPVQIQWICEQEKKYSSLQNCSDFLSIMDFYQFNIGSGGYLYSLPKETYCDVMDGIKFINRLIDLQELSCSLLTNSINLSKKELHDIFVSFSTISNDPRELEEIPESLVTIYYVFGIYLQSILKEYKNAKDFYRRNNQETNFLEIENLILENSKLKQDIEEAREKIRESIIENDDWERKVKKAKTDIEKQLYGQLHDQKSEIEILKNSIRIEQEKNQEISKLREAIFKIDTEEMVEEQPLEPLMIPEKVKILLVGGHENWRKKVKERFPFITTVDGTNQNIETELFNQSYLVLFYTPHMNHATYEKVINYVVKNKIKYEYINDQNLDKFMAHLRKIIDQ